MAKNFTQRLKDSKQAFTIRTSQPFGLCAFRERLGSVREVAFDSVICYVMRYFVVILNKLMVNDVKSFEAVMGRHRDPMRGRSTLLTRPREKIAAVRTAADDGHRIQASSTPRRTGRLVTLPAYTGPAIFSSVG